MNPQTAHTEESKTKHRIYNAYFQCNSEAMIMLV